MATKEDYLEDIIKIDPLDAENFIEEFGHEMTKIEMITALLDARVNIYDNDLYEPISDSLENPRAGLRTYQGLRKKDAYVLLADDLMRIGVRLDDLGFKQLAHKAYLGVIDLSVEMGIKEFSGELTDQVLRRMGFDAGIFVDNNYIAIDQLLKSIVKFGSESEEKKALDSWKERYGTKN